MLALRPAGIQDLYAYANYETMRAVSAMAVEPAAAAKATYDGIFTALKADSLLAILDGLYHFAAHTQQASRVNLIRPGRWNLAIIGAPTHVPGVGWTGNGTTGVLSPSFIPLTAGGQWVLDSAHVGVDIVAGASEDKYDVGRSGTGDVLLGSRWLDGNHKSRLNNDTSINVAVADPPTGHWVISRTDSAGWGRYRDGVALAAAVSASTSVPDGTIVFLGVSGASTSKTQAWGHMGGGLSATDVANLFAALH